MTVSPIHSIVFFDLDGTLFDGRGKVPDEVVNEIKTMKSRGILPVISSGRSPFEVQTTLNRTGIDSIVAMTGGYVIVDGKEVSKSIISNEIIESLLAEVDLTQTPVAYYNRYENVVSNMTDDVTSTYQHIHSPVPKVSPDYYKQHEVNMMLIFSQSDEPELQSQFKQRLHFFRNIPFAMDITESGVSKASGLKTVISMFDSEVQTYAFGDGKNDLPMASVVDHFVAMGNAAPEVKNVADYVTSDNTDHGIINGLRHYGLETKK